MKKINIILVLLVMLLSGCSKTDDAQDETTYYISENETTEMTSAGISDGLKAVYELTDKVYFGNDMQLWTDFSLSAKALHKGFCSDVCEIEIEGERCKAMYTDEEGIVIYNHNGNLVAYCNGEKYTFPFEFDFGAGNEWTPMYLDDIDNDGMRELIFDDRRDMTYIEILKFSPMKLIKPTKEIASDIISQFTSEITSTVYDEASNSVEIFFYVDRNGERIIEDSLYVSLSDCKYSKESLENFTIECVADFTYLKSDLLNPMVKWGFRLENQSFSCPQLNQHIGASGNMPGVLEGEGVGAELYYTFDTKTGDYVLVEKPMVFTWLSGDETIKSIEVGVSDLDKLDNNVMQETQEQTYQTEIIPSENIIKQNEFRAIQKNDFSKAYGDEYLQYHYEIYKTYADLNHDGIEDCVQVVLHSNVSELKSYDTTGESMINVYVYQGDSDGTFCEKCCFISKDFGIMHATNGIIDIVSKDGKKYILLGSINETFGEGSYNYEVIYFDTDKDYETQIVANQAKTPCYIIIEEEYSDVFYNYSAHCEDWPSKKHKTEAVADLKKNIQKWLYNDELLYGAVVGGTEFSSTNDSINTANLFYDTLWEYKDTVVKYDYFENVLGYEEGFYVCEKIKNNNYYIHFFDMHGNEIAVFFVEDVEFENCQDIYFEYDVENKKLVMSYLMKNKEEYESMLLSGKD